MLETYIRLGFLMIEALVVMKLTQILVDGLRAPEGFKLKSMKGLPSMSAPQISFVLRKKSGAPDPLMANFTPAVAAPVSLPLTQTLSVPYPSRPAKA